MNIKPMTDHILVKRAPRKESENGIVLPNVKHDDKTTEGVVVAIGPKVVDVSVGDNITFPKYCNKEFVVEEEKYLILREQEVFAVVP